MYLYYRRGKTSFFMGIVETFVRMNFSPEASVDAPCGIEAPSSVGADSAKAAGFAPQGIRRKQPAAVIASAAQPAKWNPIILLALSLREC